MHKDRWNPPPHTEPPSGRASSGPLSDSPEPEIDSHALLAGRRTVLIRHHGAVYRLQATRQGKLILTK